MGCAVVWCRGVAAAVVDNRAGPQQTFTLKHGGDGANVQLCLQVRAWQGRNCFFSCCVLRSISSVGATPIACDGRGAPRRRCA